ncbi:MAG TPA: TIM barrel protein [Candidatus Nanoarchaeia archaeon]|nr:TIM barrel protein [Candidatus Nanoarchaeia archaeon]
MDFGTLSYRGGVTDYFNAMDPIAGEVYQSGHSGGQGHSHSHIDKDNYGVSDDLNLGIKDIGMSVPMGISAQNVAGIYSKIRMGAGNIEIQFPGYRSGNRNAQTPEMYGEDQRQAIRELSMANEVKFTTHASFQLMGLMGRDERGNFSLYNATQDLFELKRAIDFQGDLGGGSVVIHSGEFERPMTDMYLDDESGRLNLARDQSGRLLFKQAHTNEMDAKFELLDDRTSAKIETVQKDRLVAHPVWNKADNNYQGFDQDGKPMWIKRGDYIDYDGKYIKNPYDVDKGRVPRFDPIKRLFDIKLKSFEDFRVEAEEFNKWFEKLNGRKPTYYEKMYPEEAYIKATLDSQESVARGWSLQFSRDSESLVQSLKKLEEAEEYYKKLDAELPENEKWKIFREDREIQQITQGFAAPEMKHPLELIQKAKFDVKRRLDYDRSTAAGQEQQARDTHETKEHIITPIKRLEKHGIRLYAEAAVHAIRKTSDPNNPVVLAIEHIFPERFGGHPEELKWIISKTRERVVDMLTKPEIPYGASMQPEELTKEKLDLIREDKYLQPNPYYMGVSREEAVKIAEKHVKATIDTGHINLWRKYWQEDPRKSKEDNDAAFNHWAVKQIESLAKDHMVGNVHLADNYGYHDDHLAPGQGNSPVRDILSTIKKYGYDKAITVEPGADASTDLSDFHGLMKTWKYFGTSVYGMGFKGNSPQAWGDVQFGYFGQAKPPNYIFGGYAPSNDWTLWSQVPLE